MKRIFILIKNLFKKKEDDNDNKDMIFELTGQEGSEYTDLIVNYWGYKNKLIKYYGPYDKRKNRNLHFFVKVIGFKDDIAKDRNWGVQL